MESGLITVGHGDDTPCVTGKTAGPFYVLKRSFAFDTGRCVGANTIPRAHRASGVSSPWMTICSSLHVGHSPPDARTIMGRFDAAISQPGNPLHLFVACSKVVRAD
jgi:hypothetical protein